MSHVSALIESCKRLYLHRIEEPEPNLLRLMVVEAIAGTPYTKTDFNIFELEKILGDAKPIAYEPGSKVFELSWSDYVAYSVRNESYVSEDDSEIKTGRLLLEYSSSKYLDFIRSATFAGIACRKPLKHFGICCMDHIIDVVSEEGPVIKALL
jgi:hypothetical protein